MNYERLLVGIGRRILTRLAFRGIERVAAGPEKDRTSEEKAERRAARQTARKARQGAKVVRRFMRMR